jgi:hypothetical protein
MRPFTTVSLPGARTAESLRRLGERSLRYWLLCGRPVWLIVVGLVVCGCIDRGTAGEVRPTSTGSNQPQINSPILLRRPCLGLSGVSNLGLMLNATSDGTCRSETSNGSKTDCSWGAPALTPLQRLPLRYAAESRCQLGPRRPSSNSPACHAPLPAREGQYRTLDLSRSMTQSCQPLQHNDDLGSCKETSQSTNHSCRLRREVQISFSSERTDSRPFQRRLLYRFHRFRIR